MQCCFAAALDVTGRYSGEVDSRTKAKRHQPGGDDYDPAPAGSMPLGVCQILFRGPFRSLAVSRERRR
jgi:hypothetical protein